MGHSRENHPRAAGLPHPRLSVADGDPRVKPHRRLILQTAMAGAVSACGVRLGHADEAERPRAPPALKALAPFPVGTCLATSSLADAGEMALVERHFSQITPEWEMKMERLLSDDGRFRFDAADALARFCVKNRLRLHGHTLVWYAENPVAFQRRAGDRADFEQSYRQYIATVVGRYRGLARGWDVLNEAVAEQGDGYRGGLWEATLGSDYAAIAFEACRQADPDALRFVNDYNLEIKPAKLDAFQRLIERLLRRGVSVTGLGTQTHLDADLAPGVAGRAIKALAAFGLPIHVSELDVSTHRGLWPGPPDAARLARQARIVDEVAEAFMSLPSAQRYAFTVWGVRDPDSWLTRSPGGDPSDQPLLFDSDGQPKPAFFALEAAFARGGPKGSGAA
jgi:endo-1,4-beta-xylanase